MFATLKEYREASRQNVEYACGGRAGRPENDPVYRIVTEGRDPGTGHTGDVSSCGFLPAWLWFQLGIRAGFVNRGENTKYGYRNRQNISLLCGPDFGGRNAVPSGALRTPLPGSRFECGDVLVIWNHEDTQDAHTLVVLEHRPDGVLVSGHYGQPGAAVREPVITIHDVIEKGVKFKVPYLGSRRIRRWAPLELALQAAELRGELVAPTFLGSQPDTEPPSPSDSAPAPHLERPTLKRGASGPILGPYVREVQDFLRIKVDGDFGPITELTVIAFQRTRMLKPDGEVGPLTWFELLKEHGS